MCEETQMSKVYKVTLTNAEDKALRYVALDPQEWIDNAIHERCKKAIETIVTEQVQISLEEGKPIAGTKEEIVLNAQIKSAYEREQEREQEIAKTDASGSQSSVFFAKIDSNIVTQILELDKSVLEGATYPTSESKGQTHITSLGHTGEWRQTSISGAFRYNFAQPGYKFDRENDAFIAPAPYPDWKLDEDTFTWAPPTPKPLDGGNYKWDSGSSSWVSA